MRLPFDELRLPRSIRRELVEHARGDAPREACGLFVVVQGEVVRYRPVRNVAAIPTHRFELDGAEVLRVIDDELNELRPGWVHYTAGNSDFDHFPLFGVFHSHAKGLATPSAADVAMPAGWSWPLLIYAVQRDNLHACAIEREDSLTTRYRNLRVVDVDE